MRCILVFDNLNDIIFMRCNKHFSKHIFNLALAQGLIEEHAERVPSLDIILQLFSPLITSQRIMINHFSNSYSAIKCYDGLCILFDEYMGYLFACIGYDGKYWLKRQLEIFVALVRSLCGPDVSTLKFSRKKNRLVGSLIETWCNLAYSDQSVLVEAVEQLRINPQVASACLKNLTEVAEKIKSSLSYSQVHALILVKNKFVSLYSTRNAFDLQPRDILLLSLVGEVIQKGVLEEDYNVNSESQNDSDSEDELENSETGSICSPDNRSDTMSVKSCIRVGCDNFSGYLIFLLGKQRPCAVHISYIADNIPVFLIYEASNELLNSCILDTIQSLYSLQSIQMRGTMEREVIYSSVDMVDNAFKKASDIFKKKSNTGVNKTDLNSLKVVIKKWEPIKKKYHEYMKTNNMEMLRTVDSSIDSIVILMRSLYTSCMMNESTITKNHDFILPLFKNLKINLSSLIQTLKAPGQNSNNTPKSTLSFNRYLEEFPGLVHFMYIDRITHRFIGPNLDFSFSSPETAHLAKKKIWSMVEFARNHLSNGHTRLMWKDTVFNYSYFLWFEDISGNPLRPKVLPQTIIKTLPPPGILIGDFYYQLIKKCFPSQASQKVRCFELFCVHLGLITATCVLEQSRRLTATIWEVTGTSTNPLDLL